MSNGRFHLFLFAVCGLLATDHSFAADQKDVRAALQLTRDTQTNTASEPSVMWPTMGYVVQRGPLEVRAIYGVPGAATFSPPLRIPPGVTRVHAAMGQPFALIERREDGLAVLPLFPEGTGAPIPIAGAVRTADLVEFSPKSTSALLYSRSQERLQVLSGLPDSPEIVSDLDAHALPDGIISAALSDDGLSALVASETGVYAISASESSFPQVLSPSGWVSLAFIPNSSVALIGDSGSGNLFIRSAKAPTPQVIANGFAGLKEIRPTSDGVHLWISNPGGRLVWSFNVSNGDIKVFPLEVTPSQMSRLTYPDTFLVSFELGEPAWIIRGQPDEIVAVMVPAAPPANRLKRRVGR